MCGKCEGSCNCSETVNKGDYVTYEDVLIELENLRKEIIETKEAVSNVLDSVIHKI